MRVTVIPIVTGTLVMIPKGLEKKPGEIRNQRKNWKHTDHNMVNISQNTEKSSGDLRRLTATQTPLKDDQPTLLWKSHKE